MKKVISFSLWGSNPKYFFGIKPNIELAKQYYPDFECWFYIDKTTVPEEIINDLQTNYSNVKIIYMDYDIDKINPYAWRFLAIDDPEVEIMLSRDLDSRISERESTAVKEWINSNKIFHIMRDHPLHNDTHILAGMFGIKKNKIVTSWRELLSKQCKSKHYNQDQTFLSSHIYPKFLSVSMIHTSFYRFNGESPYIRPFIKYNDEFNFVGEIFNEHGRIQEHIDILKNNIHKLINPLKYPSPSTK